MHFSNCLKNSSSMMAIYMHYNKNNHFVAIIQVNLR